ncbi:hypothetical protein A6M27_10970 [Acidithiobacillus thiooxidans]|uniref:DUF4390 domain-containing protein n=1 Tax=Acidithiobacillus thiooxidans TaxID=930 RepID=A0A1C2IUM2_ACITH|nr:DUF4390 domain-containing protein [Acidithiobacillus thiooxidans]OCX67397.1 hypothetical protein A6O24_20950 [Acidithiobacillus thiooxidans]OCX69354.1 hypothetical protein A6P07_16665 [Acidithiobacillus thiooxidans]OCX79708.1 hypothetical protein A6O26_16105 [Acidithiobacillus thiooxidans]OCX87112.1 hypothetical protein A6M27_10970 [Acidithiobacillus thiooxidans]OFC41005.1 hypothetical protein BAE47_19015 [Acidithiobacillus thiooxidans]
MTSVLVFARAGGMMRKRGAVLLGLILGFWCFVGSGWALAGTAFHVEQLQVAPEMNRVKINAQVQITKEDLLQEILDQGQTLIWVVKAEWREPEPFSFITGLGTHAQKEVRWQIHYYPLTNQYALKNAAGTLRLFNHWQDVVSVLKQIHDFELPLQQGAARGRVALRVYVDIQALPVPLRLRALLDHWKLESPWTVSALLSN